MSRSVGLLARDTDLRTFGNTEAAYALRAGSRMPAPKPVAFHLPAPGRELDRRAAPLSRARECPHGFLPLKSSRRGKESWPAGRPYSAGLASSSPGVAGEPHDIAPRAIASPWTHSCHECITPRRARRGRGRRSGGEECTFHARTLVRMSTPIWIAHLRRRELHTRGGGQPSLGLTPPAGWAGGHGVMRA